MAEYGNTNMRHTDEYGNTVINRPDGGTDNYGATGGGAHEKKGMMEKLQEKLPGHKTEEERTYGSTTAEHGGGGGGGGGVDEYEQGEGHHEKKGIVENIKEKLPGHKTEEGRTYGTTTEPRSGGLGYDHEQDQQHHDLVHDHEKKGMMDKIKEKLPGDKEPTYGASATTGHGQAGLGYEQDQQQHHYDHEKKGVMDKIKEKLPGNKTGEEQTYGTTTTDGHGHGQGQGVGYEEEHHDHEKKGMIEKIKEKLGGGKPEEQTNSYGTATGAEEVGYEQKHHEKTKDMMEEIKDGHH